MTTPKNFITGDNRRQGGAFDIEQARKSENYDVVGDTQKSDKDKKPADKNQERK